MLKKCLTLLGQVEKRCAPPRTDEKNVLPPLPFIKMTPKMINPTTMLLFSQDILIVRITVILMAFIL